MIAVVVLLSVAWVVECAILGRIWWEDWKVGR